ncbi:MAG: hypothetical protein GY865_13095, partial [candidate division Zixibacteria bacterium]|nr:hypothetical protein [candidate division Zixibacteria bacterium]
NTISGGTTGVYANINQGQVTITGNNVFGSSSHGIYCNNTGTSFDHLITLNTVTGNGGYGIQVVSVGPAKVFFNDVHNNIGSGLYMQAADGSRVHYNNLYSNQGSYAIENGNSASVDGRYNYFGSVVTALMATGDNPKDIGRIHDSFDDVALGTILYDPWLNDVQTLPIVPVSKIITPTDGSVLTNTLVQTQGIAISPAGMGSVELSTDGGTSWQTVSGADIWSSDFTLMGDGTYTFMSRTTDADTVVETPGPGVTVTVDTSLPTTSGTLNEDETWSGTITVTGDVIVPEGMTLTLLPGTEVLFSANYDDTTGGTSGSQSELIVKGSLVADNTTFNSSAATPLAGDWYGIRLLAQNNNASLTLTDCTLSYAEQGLTVVATGGYNAPITITNSTITQKESPYDKQYILLDNKEI